MRTYFDCIPCFLRQTLDAVRDLGLDPSLQEHVLREVLGACAELDLGQSPPVMGQRIHRVIREASGNADPYAEMKERFNHLALGLYAECRDAVERANDPLEAALRLAIAGNVIDAAPKSGLSEEDVRRSMLQALTEPLDGDVDDGFARSARRAPNQTLDRTAKEVTTMPRGDGTGPPGGGQRGQGRMGGPRAAGPSGNCVCPQCGHKAPHVRGQPCNQQTCPQCGAMMTRE